MTRTIVSLSGFRELDAALGELPKAISRGVLHRTLRKAAEPIAEEARHLAPVDEGDLEESISVSTRIKNKVGGAEFSAVLRSGGTKAEAVQALRDARRAAGGAGSFAEVFVGPAVPQGFHAHFVEFGTEHSAPQPFMRPAWDSRKDAALVIMKEELGNEIIRAARRLGKSKKRSADVKYRASIAAMMAAQQGYTG